jgi:flagellar motor switch protein FliN/FliY
MSEQEFVDQDIVKAIGVEVLAVLGQTQVKVSQLLKLGRGAVVELGKKTEDPLDIYVNGCKIATADVQIKADRIYLVIR